MFPLPSLWGILQSDPVEVSPLTFQEDRVSQLIFVRFMELRKRRLPHRGRKGLVEQAPLY